MAAGIAAVDYYLPARISRTREWASDFPGWPAEKMMAKLGIDARHVAAEDECASDMAVQAAEKLLATHPVDRASIDYLILLTQTADYMLPTTACLLQHRLGLSKDIGAMDVNLGCSGYVYGLGLAQGLIATGQAGHVLLLTADTYSKVVNPADRPIRALLGDAATATLVRAGAGEMGSFVFGTDGERAMHIVVPAGGMRKRRPDFVLKVDDKGNARTDADAWIDGKGMFGFSAEVVPRAVERTLARAKLTPSDIDLFVFHQANQHMLEHLRDKLALPEEKVLIDMRDCGSTGSSSIPMVLSRATAAGRLTKGMRLLLVGYGVGLSWGACVVRW